VLHVCSWPLSFLFVSGAQGALGWSWLAHGLKEVPSIAAISLYKHDGILQVGALGIAAPRSTNRRSEVQPCATSLEGPTAARSDG